MAHGTWYFAPQSFSDITGRATTIVEAQVVSVQAGPDIVTKAPGEPGGVDRIPTEQITLQVQGSDKGTAQTGQTIQVFRTGSNGEPPAPKNPSQQSPPPTVNNARVFMVDGDPAYQPGQKYFLALEAGPNNLLRPVSPEGRYLINSDGTVSAVTDSPVAMGVQGHQLAELKAAATGGKAIPNTNEPMVSASQQAPAGDPSKGPFGTPLVQKRVTTGGTVPGMPTTGMPALVLWGMILAALAAAGIGLGLFLRRRTAR